MNIKRFIFILLVMLVITTVFLSLNSFCNDTNIRVYINNDELQFDVPPALVDGTTLVPVRALLEKLGATVEWIQDTQTVTVVKGQTTIQLQLNNKTAYVNGKPVELDVPLKYMNGRTLVPLRFISENLGTDVKWDNATKSIKITHKPSKNELDNIPNDKVRNGFEKYTWSNGTTYEGEWKDNKVHGKGTITYTNGDKYSGSFSENKKNGQGIYTWSNGESYIGNWLNDKMDGNGTYSFKNGDVYNGNWVSGKMDGKGTYTYKDGRTLTGIWRENIYSAEK